MCTAQPLLFSHRLENTMTLKHTKDTELKGFLSSSFFSILTSLDDSPDHNHSFGPVKSYIAHTQRNAHAHTPTPSAALLENTPSNFTTVPPLAPQRFPNSAVIFTRPAFPRALALQLFRVSPCGLRVYASAQLQDRHGLHSLQYVALK